MHSRRAPLARMPGRVVLTRWCVGAGAAACDDAQSILPRPPRRLPPARPSTVALPSLSASHVWPSRR
eukprot:3369038-Rhodomonas_salina.1